MALFATIRHRRNRRARRAIGVFAVVWLNLVLQPCAMALDAEPDCPNCPPSHSQHLNDHTPMSGGMTDKEMPCATGVNDCDILDGFNYDGRSVQVKVKDTPNELSVALLPATDGVSGIELFAEPVLRPVRRFPPGPPPPLNKLFCIYLK